MNILKYITVWSCLTGSVFVLFVSLILIRLNSENNSFFGENILAYTTFFILSCISFLLLIKILKEIYDWNDGYSRYNGELWIQDFLIWNHMKYFYAGNHSVALNLEYLKPKYNHKNAKLKFKNRKLISNLNSFN